MRAALRQHERPIVIEDQDLARPFIRLLRARDINLRPLGGLFAEMMSYAIRRCYGFDIETHWYIGRYVLPGNVQKVSGKLGKLLLTCSRVTKFDCNVISLNEAQLTQGLGK